MYEKKQGNPYYINRHSCFLLQYHMVLVTKYRHPVITGKLKETLYKRIAYLFNERNLHILECNGGTDHVHILYEADPFTSPGELANMIKTQTSRYIRKLYKDTLLKQWY